MIFVHLYNDSSGSPRVLKDVIDSLYQEGDILFIGSDGQGVLTQSSIPKKYFFYKKFNNKLLVLLAYLISQLDLFLRLSCNSECRKSDCIYVNTVLPFGGALFGKIFGVPVIYHVHEVAIKPKILFDMLLLLVRVLATEVILVSKYQERELALVSPEQNVIYNSVSKHMVEKASSSNVVPWYLRNERFTVLMLASFRTYKGVDIFIELCIKMGQNFRFILILNDSDDMVDSFRYQNRNIEGLEILNRTDEPSGVYSRCDLVINLSRSDQWIETFGLTIVEAFCFSKPVIAPSIGGPTEIVQHGVNGYLIDSKNLIDIESKIKFISESPSLYDKLSNNAYLRSLDFSPEKFSSDINNVVKRRR